MAIDLLTNINLRAEPTDDEHLVNIEWIKAHVSTDAILIPNTAGTDLNTYRDPGEYYNPATASANIANQPGGLAGAFALSVEQHVGRVQTYTAATSNRVFKRSCPTPTGAWGGWVEIMVSTPLTENFVPIMGAAALADSAISRQLAYTYYDPDADDTVTAPERITVSSQLQVGARPPGQPPDPEIAVSSEIRMSNRERMAPDITSTAGPYWYDDANGWYRYNGSFYIRDNPGRQVLGWSYNQDYNEGGADARQFDIVSLNLAASVLQSTRRYHYDYSNDQLREHSETFAIRAPNGNEIVGSSINYFTNNYSTILRMAGQPIVHAQRSTTPVNSLVNFHDAAGRLALRIVGGGAAPTIDVNQHRVWNLPPGRLPTDAATIHNLKYDTLNNPSSVNKGELYPATEYASRAAAFAAFGQQSVVESFEVGTLVDNDLASEMEVVENYIEGGPEDVPGWEIGSIRAQHGSRSIHSLSNGLHNTRAIITFMLGTTITAHNLQLYLFSSAETNYDGLQIELFDQASMGSLYRAPPPPAQLIVVTQNVWVQQTVPRPAGSGSQLLTLRYRKDGSVNSGSDRIWIDNIRFNRDTGTVATQAVVFPESGGFIHAFVSNNEIFETRLARGQTFRNPANMQLRGYNGSALVNA